MASSEITLLEKNGTKYRGFQIFDQCYYINDVVLVDNIPKPEEPLILKIEDISTVSSDIVIQGRFMYPSYHQVISNGSKVCFKELFQMGVYEILYGNVTGIIDPFDILDLVKVFQVTDFKAQFPNLYTTKRKPSVKKYHTFYCSRAIISRRLTIWDEFTWEGYLKNVTFGTNTRGGRKLVTASSTATVTPKTVKTASVKSGKTPQGKTASVKKETSQTPQGKTSIAKKSPDSPNERVTRSMNNTPKGKSRPGSAMNTPVHKLVQRAKSSTPKSTQKTPSKVSKKTPSRVAEQGTPTSGRSTRSTRSRGIIEEVSEDFEFSTPALDDRNKRKRSGAKVLVKVESENEDSEATEVVQTPIKKRKSPRAKGKKSSPTVETPTKVTTVSSKGRVRVSRQIKGNDSDSEGTNASNDDDFKKAVSESESDTESESDSSVVETDNEEYEEGGNRTIQVKRKVFSNLKYKVRRNPKKLMNLQLAARKEKIQEAGTDFEKAAKRLHVSAVPDSLPCREEEFAELYSQLASAIQEDISGIPGTGKTATFKAVLRQLQAEVEEDELEPFEFVEINGMKLTEPKQAYSVLYEGLTAEKVSASHAEHLLLSRFTSLNADQRPCVVLMDELDMLVTQKQSVVYNFFEWPNLPYSRLIVVAIANTMDLPERMLSNKVSSRLGLTRMTFQPYSHVQLTEIVESRLEGLNVMQKDAIMMCARRVSAVCGDARRCLDVSRRAMEIRADRDPDGVVCMDDINAAIKEMTTSKSVLAVKHCSVQQRVFLVACMNLERKTGISDLIFMDVEEEHVMLCRLAKLPEPLTSDLHSICAYLSQYHVIIAENTKAGFPHQKLKLNINVQDIITGINTSKHPKLMKLLK